MNNEKREDLQPYLLNQPSGAGASALGKTEKASSFSAGGGKGCSNTMEVYSGCARELVVLGIKIVNQEVKKLAGRENEGQAG